MHGHISWNILYSYFYSNQSASAFDGPVSLIGFILDRSLLFLFIFQKALAFFIYF